MKGFVHIYTGDGKGKTTAAVGLALRACGRGKRVLFYQFLKCEPSGEELALAGTNLPFTVRRAEGHVRFSWQMTAAERAEACARQGRHLAQARGELAAGMCDLMVLDEIVCAVENDFLPLADLEQFVRERPEGTELLLTGAGAGQRILALGDYVSVISKQKHPFDTGVAAREGIEF